VPKTDDAVSLLATDGASETVDAVAVPFRCARDCVALREAAADGWRTDETVCPPTAFRARAEGADNGAAEKMPPSSTIIGLLHCDLKCTADMYLNSADM
jgi:hypothetical protein